MGKFTLVKFGKKPPKQNTQSPLQDHCQKVATSLGTGTLTDDMVNVTNFEPSITNKIITRVGSDRTLSISELSGTSSDDTFPSDRSSSIEINREQSTFLRVSDLDMPSSSFSSSLSDITDDPIPNFHHPATDPPPGIKRDVNEMWIALNDGATINTDSASPIGALAISKLAEFGLATCLDSTMWTPDGKTNKLIHSHGCQQPWMNETFKTGGCVDLDSCDGTKPNDKEVLIWTGNFNHGKYGSHLPAIRAAGLVNMSAKALMGLMVDSNRVKEYNKFSLGRRDLVTFPVEQAFGQQNSIVTKVMKSQAKPPMVRKIIEFVSILHVQELVDRSGYLLVTRAVEQPQHDQANDNLNKSEILLGVNVIRKVKGHENSKCVMINVNHINSPMIPMMLAKRIGLSSAVNFVNDVRNAAASTTC